MFPQNKKFLCIIGGCEKIRECRQKDRQTDQQLKFEHLENKDSSSAYCYAVT
jgi:hypothetical protein